MSCIFVCTYFFTADDSVLAGSAMLVFITLSGPKEQGLITWEQQDRLAAVVLCSNQQHEAEEVN